MIKVGFTGSPEPSYIRIFIQYTFQNKLCIGLFIQAYVKFTQFIISIPVFSIDLYNLFINAYGIFF